MRTSFVGFISCVLLATIGLFWLAEHNRRVRVIANLNLHNADLQASLRASEAEVLQLRSRIVEAPQVQPSPGMAVDLELRQRVAQLAQTQSNMLAMLEGILQWAGPDFVLTPQGKEEQMRKGISFLEDTLAEEQPKLEDLKQKVTDLMATLNVTDEIARMDARAGLDSPSLERYWPYFEAKRNRDAMQRQVEILVMKITQERLDAGF